MRKSAELTIDTHLFVTGHLPPSRRVVWLRSDAMHAARRAEAGRVAAFFGLHGEPTLDGLLSERDGEPRDGGNASGGAVVAGNKGELPADETPSHKQVLAERAAASRRGEAIARRLAEELSGLGEPWLLGMMEEAEERVRSVSDFECFAPASW